MVARWLRGGLRRRLPTFKPSPHALTRRRARTHAYLQAVITLISLKIMGSICSNLGRKKNATLSGEERREERGWLVALTPSPPFLIAV